MGATWNSLVGTSKSICKGKDWNLFFKVMVTLMILKFLGTFSLQTVFLIGGFAAFGAFVVYDKMEGEIDGLLHEALCLLSKLKSDMSQKFLTSKQSHSTQ
eukprot:TRINITY_DN11774_c0_g4_i1.p2 TRINITY_DN11774_c0_g4~~TRINITY_DN11774_c0_g4_i1.p2  ORF type:complete len:117 (+),score=10.98 TRINITY_DN11774_c0_g4_i1:54-353(+)